MTFLAKICLIGDGKVGKTSLKDVFAGQGFNTNYLPTLGCDYISKDVSIETDIRKANIRLQIWDLAGQPTFKTVRSSFYRGSVAAILVFDVTNVQSLYNLEVWIEELFRNSNSFNQSFLVLGNKVDLRKELQNTIPPQTAVDFVSQNLLPIVADQYGEISYSETSAKTGENVEASFCQLAGAILRKQGALQTTEKKKSNNDEFFNIMF